MRWQRWRFQGALLQLESVDFDRLIPRITGYLPLGEIRPPPPVQLKIVGEPPAITEARIVTDVEFLSEIRVGTAVPHSSDSNRLISSVQALLRSWRVSDRSPLLRLRPQWRRCHRHFLAFFAIFYRIATGANITAKDTAHNGEDYKSKIKCIPSVLHKAWTKTAEARGEKRGKNQNDENGDQKNQNPCPYPRRRRRKGRTFPRLRPKERRRRRELPVSFHGQELWMRQGRLGNTSQGELSILLNFFGLHLSIHFLSLLALLRCFVLSVLPI